jgi:hypothetical protein
MNITNLARIYGFKNVYRWDTGDGYYFYIAWRGKVAMFKDEHGLPRYMYGDLDIIPELGKDPKTNKIKYEKYPASAIYWIDKSDVIFYLRNPPPKFWYLHWSNKNKKIKDLNKKRAIRELFKYELKLDEKWT